MALAVLFESALGYAVFDVAEAEDIGIEMDSVQEAVQDLAKFGKICKLKAMMPFRSAQEALENMNAISEGIVTDMLKNFLETNLPKTASTNKASFRLGVSDNRIGQAVAETLSIKCDHTGVVPELIRGIRMHFSKMHKSLKDISVEKAQLGLGHSYSRAKVKFNVHRVDNMIIQAINILDQLDKDINTFAMRIREWYSYHFPELFKIVSENLLFARLVKFIGRRTSLKDDSLEQLEELVMDSAKAQQIIDAAKTSMGMEISEVDLTNVLLFAERLISLAEYRQKLSHYLHQKMMACAPNLTNLIGEQVGARLISHAGSLTNLAKYPASTVQILGAEKALFRALKTRGNTPKYGLLFHSSYIGRAGAKNKGRISRYVANKCSIASRIDCFSDNLTGEFGKALKDQVEERLQFYDSGDAPRKNVDVMHSVLERIQVKVDGEAETPKPKKRKASDDGDEKDVATPSTDKKKKKKRKSEAAASNPDTPKSDKKKKKKKSKDSA